MILQDFKCPQCGSRVQEYEMDGKVYRECMGDFENRTPNGATCRYFEEVPPGLKVVK